MTGTANKTGKLEQDSDNEDGTRTMIAISGQGDSQCGDPERGLSVELEQRPGRGPERRTRTEAQTGT